jgi:predicted TIM-barrel fold metal-dependent hydrolase
MARGRYDGPTIDSDIHHTWTSDKEVIDYLPPRWREFASARIRGSVPLSPPTKFASPTIRFTRADAVPASGGPAGSSIDLMCEQLLDPHRVVRGIVTFEQGQHPAVANIEFAIALERAANMWSIDHWLTDGDSRLFGAISVQTHVPSIAAAQIRELAVHPRIAEILLIANSAAHAVGHPHFHPIFEAAAEVGKPIALHVGGETVAPNIAGAGGGPSPDKLHRHTLQGHPLHHYWVSLIVHGVFEKFPDLRIIAKEAGLAAWPHILWELDAAAPLLKQETTWLKRLPSDYFRQHAVVTSQPLDESPRAEQLIAALEVFEGIEDHICFASDYPHYDADTPDHVAKLLPPAWWSRIFYENARRFYRWNDLPASVNDASLAMLDRAH